MIESTTKKILLVDDEFAIRYLVEHNLRSLDYETIHAKNGAEGVEMAQIHQPDLIILDIMMPEMDGFAVCRAIKENPDLEHIPVIFLTAMAQEEHKQLAFELGASDYITKPFSGDRFLAHVTAVLQHSEDVQQYTQPLTQEKGFGRVAAFLGAKGGVGTTTLTIQLGEALALQEQCLVLIIDLALPLGGIAPALTLYTHRHILDLLHNDELTLEKIEHFAQPHRANIHVIPAPGTLHTSRLNGHKENLKQIFSIAVEAGYHVLLDLGSQVTPVTQLAMRQAHANFLVTSGKEVANRMVNGLIESADSLRVSGNRLFPVVNFVHGEVEHEIDLLKLPVATIPHADAFSRKAMWLREQGFRKLTSLII